MGTGEKEISRRRFLNKTAAVAGAGLGAMIMRSDVMGAVPPSDRVNLAFIGTGARAHQLMDSALNIEGVEVVKICDAYQSRITRAIERCKGRPKAVDHYRKILDDKSVDAVYIGTPDHWHKQMCIEAVQAGKDVYCDKPLTYTVDEGLEIIRAVKASDRVFQVGSQGISSKVQRKARDVIASGKLGQITMIRAYFNRNTPSGSWIYPIPPDANRKTVNWEQFLGSAPKVAFDLERFFRWRCYQDYSGGISTDLFVHLCTTIHWLMSVEAPSRVMGMGALYRWRSSRDVPDTINASLEYKEGFMVNMSGTFNNTMTSGAGFQVLGTEGSLEIGGSLKFVPETPMNNDRWVVRSWPVKMEKAYYANPKIIEYEKEAKARAEAAKPEKLFERDDTENPTTTHLQRFIDCVRNRTKPEQNAEVGHRAAAVAHMVNRSVETGNTVCWDFENQRIKKW